MEENVDEAKRVEDFRLYSSRSNGVSRRNMKILITGGNGNIAQMITRNLNGKNGYEISNPSRKELNILCFDEVEKYLNMNHFDILVHTAIEGGRRTKEETGQVVYNNMLMMENLLFFSDRFKMIINFDSAAIYDRATDILNRKEDDVITIPKDYYGFSKYVIHQRGLQHDNFYNIRIFNIFHANEECNRFIKACFIAKQNNTDIIIHENKWFDFFYEDDFIALIMYYFNNVTSLENLQKTINVCYDKKYKLSDIAELILHDKSKIIIHNNDLLYNYSGNNTQLQKMGIQFIGLENSIQIYNNIFTSNI